LHIYEPHIKYYLPYSFHSIRLISIYNLVHSECLKYIWSIIRFIWFLFISIHRYQSLPTIKCFSKSVEYY